MFKVLITIHIMYLYQKITYAIVMYHFAFPYQLKINSIYIFKISVLNIYILYVSLKINLVQLYECVCVCACACSLVQTKGQPQALLLSSIPLWVKGVGISHWLGTLQEDWTSCPVNPRDPPASISSVLELQAKATTWFFSQMLGIKARSSGLCVRHLAI